MTAKKLSGSWKAFDLTAVPIDETDPSTGSDPLGGHHMKHDNLSHASLFSASACACYPVLEGPNCFQQAICNCIQVWYRRLYADKVFIGTHWLHAAQTHACTYTHMHGCQDREGTLSNTLQLTKTSVLHLHRHNKEGHGVFQSGN